MSQEWVQTQTENGILHVILNRPEKRNAITIDFLEGIADAVANADDDPTIRAVIVRGEGKIFSAGIDVMSLVMAKSQSGDTHASRWLRRYAERLQNALYRMEQTEVPIIGALHGKVLGLGLEMALAFDFRVASAECVFALPETRLGLIADVGGTTRLNKLVGPSRAKDMLMTTRELDTTEALQWGLINRVAEGADPIPLATELAHQIAANAPLAVGLAKFVVDNGDGVDRMTQMALERLAQSVLVTTEDLGEAMGAFMEKRAPQFKGR